MKQYLISFLGWVQTLGLQGALVLAVAYIPACVLFLPGSLLTLGAGFAFGVVWGTVAVSVGSTLGASAAFWVGRTLARGIMESKVQANPKFQAIDQAVEGQGFKIVLLTRLSPIFPFNLLNYAFGVTKVSFRDYFFGSWIGMLPGTILYVYLGSTLKSLADLAAGNIQGGTGQKIFFWIGLAATVAVTIFITKIAKKAIQETL